MHPRRSAAVTVQSFAVPDSDDEDIVDKNSYFRINDQEKKSKETNLQLWIKHLSDILKAKTRGASNVVNDYACLFNVYTIYIYLKNTQAGLVPTMRCDGPHNKSN
jgi:hypothetical protein